MRVFYLFFVNLLLVIEAIDENPTSELRNRLQKNAKKPPWPNMDQKPLNVKIGIYIESLGRFQSTEMSFDVDLYLYMSWRDYTLNHSNPEYVLVNDPKVKEHIWLPDLYFANARTATFHDVTVPNFNLFISQDGTIAYSSRVTLTVACNLQLSMYPMDQQTCQVRILSYAYIANQVNVTWFRASPIRYNPEIGLPEFNIRNIDQTYCDGTYMYAIMENSYKIDRFSCLEANIHLKRSVGYHLVQSYIPTALIVVISWVSFWIDRRAVPARVTLSFTTLLSLSTLGNGLRFGLPMVSYAKAIDYWFGMCMVFVFLTLLEFAFVNSYMRQANKYEKLSRALEKRQATLESDPEDGPYIPSSLYKHTYQPMRNSKKVNSGIQSSFPLSFLGIKKRIGFPHSSGSLKDRKTANGECYPCSIYTTQRRETSCDGVIGHSRFVTLASMDLEDSMTLPQSTSFQKEQSKDDSLKKDESPTKTTLISDEEWPEQLPVFEPQKVRHRRQKGRKSFHRENTTMGINRFLQLGFINSRKALNIDKLSRIFFPIAATDEVTGKE
ncbi:hypothetical protein FO519_003637 [Halicephalobus sp. NKZ332]|nr:hypothetical protein FO519_003637 [Halicephalobus sp. NKZ332]